MAAAQADPVVEAVERQSLTYPHKKKITWH